MPGKMLKLIPSFGLLLVLAACTASGTSTSSSTPSSNVSTAAPTVGTGGAAASPAAASPATGASPAVAGAQTANVTMSDANQFQPANLTIARGTTVTWTNTGTVPHTVTSDPSKAANASDASVPSGAQPWDSGMINGGGTFQHTFDTPGQYTYFCIPHEALGMVGHITVTG